MKVMNMVQAINDAMDLMLKEHPEVVIYGEDAGVEGGVFRVTEGLQQKYGAERVFDSPLAESGIVGTALGMAITGMRPVVEHRTRGKFAVPMVIRFPYGGGINALEHHSESPEAYYAHTPGLKVVIPSTPYDAKGLLISAIESNDPVIFMEPKKIYRAIKQEVPEEKYSIPLGKAMVVSPGTDITVVTYGAMVREVQRAMVMAKKEGISVELIDLRTISPIDRDTIRESVAKTGRILVVTEAQRSFSAASELMAITVEENFLNLEAPPTRLGGFDTIIPLPVGENFYRVEPEQIYYNIQKLVKY
jgi:pyruvate dehydrogenase E1 component beta subunit